MIELAMDRTYAVKHKKYDKWFHGSPGKLLFLKAGSSVTPFTELAKAYSHKPQHLELSVTDDAEENVSRVTILHDGVQSGFLYRVNIRNSLADLQIPDDNTGPLGEEMITTRNLEIDLVEEVIVCSSYGFKWRGMSSSEP